MGETNFSRAFEEINEEDGMESAIGDMVHTALDDITAVMEQESSDLDPELKQAFADKDIIKCVILTNKRLGKDYLQVQEIFQQDMKSRRKHQVKVSCAKTIVEFNEALRHCLPGQIREVLEKRGDLLMKTKKYGDAIKDFKQCQQDDSFQVPYKIGQCQAKIGKYSLAIDSLKTSLKLLQTADISNSARVQFSKTIIQSLKKLQGKPDNTCEENGGKEQFAFDENPELFGVSSKVLIKESPEQGRFAVADQDIAPGTIVAVGQPAVALLNPDRKLLMFQYCLNCLKNVSIIYPCLTCSSVVFCSQECRHRASSSFHRYQCQLNLYDKRQSDREDAFNIFMVLQVLWQRPFSFWKDNFIYPGAVMHGGGVDDDYARYWRMVRHPDKQFIKIIIISIFLLRLNRMTSYMNSSEFGEEATNIEELLTNVPEKVKPCDDTLTEDEKIVAEIIVNIFLIQDSNSHPVFRIDSGGPNNQVGLEALGSGIYPVIGSYFNHSCCPNTIRVNVGKVNYLITVSSIKKGEEVTDIYSMHFSEINREGRRSWLQRSFNFLCQCQACREDWDTFDKLDGKIPSSLRQKLEIVEKCIATSLHKRDFKAAVDFHKKDVLLLEEAKLTPHRLEISLRNSFQFALWRYFGNRQLE